jgi:hypothetical protein
MGFAHCMMLEPPVPVRAWCLMGIHFDHVGGYEGGSVWSEVGVCAKLTLIATTVRETSAQRSGGSSSTIGSVLPMSLELLLMEFALPHQCPCTFLILSLGTYCGHT